ncbi:putative epidermal cell surface receptor [Ostrinia nubilalis]|uniref:putative epidermal cell surface receptor n=1 Tax=Ostrinia nubilalis TaxID=29057 RepID=UPI0030822805
MRVCARAVALWCAVVLAARVAGYTVDCNHEYTDCDTELSKLTGEEEDLFSSKASATQSTDGTTSTTTTSTTSLPTRSTPKIEETTENKTEEITTTEVAEETSVKPKPRLLNLNVDELQTFANALHNQSNQNDPKKVLPDLSDVTLDGDEDEEPKMHTEAKHKQISDKFYSNLQAPFHPLLGVDRASGEVEVCKENEVTYKIGERIDRGCEETCECSPGGTFECSPRCKHPYIRRGRRLNDPLCFESPVDECCSIIACATGNGDMKPTKLEVCRYGNDTYPVGAQWHIGCEQTCTCEKNSIVTCKPRCERHPPSDKCINVQDPNDACCEVQVCDVSQDVHEEPENVTSSSTSTTETTRSFEDYQEEQFKTTMRPLVLPEPIGSVKVLQNNTVQVNLIHMNNTEDPIHLLLSNDNGKSFKDVELTYSNLILNLEGGKDYILKTKETGTKFNFTITASDTGANEVPDEDIANSTKVGCYQDGVFYAVGEEFHIGCTELCECTGPDTHECVALVCPSHVGLELVSKGCVRWAPSPPAQPPNCCPRSARCLSDGTCHYNGVPIPNWSEVPISLTGCEQRCFCENGDLECQETCSPLPPVPPQSLRCPPLHRPAPVNISDDDCCKQWGCLPNAASSNATNFPKYRMQTIDDMPFKYVTPIAPLLPTVSTSVLPTPPITTDPTEFYRHLSPIKTFPKFLKPPAPMFNDISKYSIEAPRKSSHGDNITVFTLEDVESPFKIIHPDPSLTSNNNHWIPNDQALTPNQMLLEPIKVPLNLAQTIQPSKQNYNNFVLSDHKMHDHIQNSKIHPVDETKYEPFRKVPISKVDRFNYFLPSYDKKPSMAPYKTVEPKTTTAPFYPTKTFFEPIQNQTTDGEPSKEFPNLSSHSSNARDHPYHSSRGKHVTILRTKDLKTRPSENNLWSQDTKTHVLTKAPNPYETVLLRPVPNVRTEVTSNYNHNAKIPRIAEKTYSALDLEHLLSQMEVESEVNRNLGRSADRNRDGTAAGHQTPATDTPTHSTHPQQPSFLPTIPPDLHFPQEDIPDYDQNNIHRPVNSLPGLPPGLHLPTNHIDDNKKLSVISLQGDSPTSVMMLFGLPPVLVGLRGSVDLRYTDKADEDITNWYSQVFAPADEVLTTPRLEFRLTGLKPSTTYKVRGKLYLHNLPVEPESEIYTVRTLDLPTVAPAEEKRREIDSRLTVVDVNDTVAHVSWRHFAEEELQFIDGIQVRYRPVGTPIYSMTELLHHSRSAAELHDLRPGSRYEASLVLIPPPRATTELHDPGVVEFTTSPYVDPYNWTVTIEARAVGSEAAELTWRGVPSPAERWVRVYRAAHACGQPATRREHDAFRLAARDLPPAVTLTGLEPDTR